MIRAAKLDVDLYEEVEADQGALRQAMLVVVHFQVSQPELEVLGKVALEGC